MKGNLSRAWLLVVMVGVAAASVLMMKSLPTRGQPQVQPATVGPDPTPPSSSTTAVSHADSLGPVQRSPHQSESAGDGASADVRVEVIHFHGTHQCNSCKMVGALAEKTVETYFKDELESRCIRFADVNGQLAENKEVVTKYGATSASLWIGTYVDGEFHSEQDLNVWLKIEDEGEYLQYLKRLLEKRLSGDLSWIVHQPPFPAGTPIRLMALRLTALRLTALRLTALRLTAR